MIAKKNFRSQGCLGNDTNAWRGDVKDDPEKFGELFAQGQKKKALSTVHICFINHITDIPEGWLLL